MDYEKYIKDEVHHCYYDLDINCARTSMRIYCTLFSQKLPEELVKAAVGMHGAGRFGAQCGLIEGTLMFIGYHFLCLKIEESEAVAACHDIAVEITDRFGSLDCRDLRKGGFNPDDPPHLCEGLSVDVITFSYSWIKKRLEKIDSGIRFSSKSLST